MIFIKLTSGKLINLDHIEMLEVTSKIRWVHLSSGTTITVTEEEWMKLIRLIQEA